MQDALARLNAALAGRYVVTGLLGEGGMATVYSADDLRHGRHVALKVLKPEIAAALGAARFLQEIRTTAALQHPHIVPLYDSGDAGGLLFYAMPRFDGESLRERLARERQLPVDEAVRIARNVAEALEHAHGKGVIHRDIKPANILLPGGEPMVSDFGIALAASSDVATRLTETGLSLGTPHYLSPEQATGERGVGPGADIWALGCVLYEMLAGEPPFGGATAQAVLGKIVTADAPSATAARKTVPAHIDAVIRKSLERVPADRFRSAAELARALADPTFRHGTTTIAARSRGFWQLLAAGFAGVAAVAVAGLLWSPADEVGADPRAAARFDVTPPDSQRLPLVPGVDFALSPDGRRFVFVGSAPSGQSLLWQRSVESLEAVPVPGTESGLHPSFSPDGSSVAFTANGEVHVVRLDGGPVVALAPGAVPTWGSDGMIYFSEGEIIHRVSERGGAPEPFTARLEGRQQRFASALPDGRGLLVSLVASGPAPELSRIGVVGPEGGAVREILEGAMARYASTGHVLYSTSGGTVMAVPFDVRRLEVTGTPTAVLENVIVKSGSASQFAVSASGTALYAVGGTRMWELLWVSRVGEARPVDPAWTADFSYPAISPDGRHVAVSLRRPESIDIWVKELDAGPALKLTLEATRNDMPAWTVGGESVTYLSNLAGPSLDFWSKRADGSGQASLVLGADTVLFEPTWSPDGEWLAYGLSSGPDADIGARRVDGSAPPIVVAGTSGQEHAPAFSPDSRFLAYTAEESGLYNVYVVPFPDVGSARWAVSTMGGSEPVWSHDGRELFHRTLAGDLVAVPVSTSPTFSMGTPRVLFPAGEYRSYLNHRQYDVSPDGQRFLMLRAVSGELPQWIIALDFLDEVRAIGR
jgi:serine/threonine-protein kinase